ncbi:MAG: hypothetical protein PF448_08640 [Bacteroidales bacterium]|nr:hypothetical protein [Bacteroidales bacterium]
MKRFFISLAILLFAGYTAIQAQNQNVSINNDGALPDNSAMLDVSSTTKGLLIPRMTSVQKEAVNNPATGLIVFDTDNNNFWYFDGTQWTSIDGGAGPSGLITDFDWDDAANLITITENGNSWQITVDNEADDLTDNVINDLSDVNATPNLGQVLKWDGTIWTAEDDEAGADGATITDFFWDDASNLLRITEDGTEWDVYIDNEADDLSDNIINDLSDVDATPAAGQVLKWDGTQWVAGNDEAGAGGTQITDFEWTDATDLLRITEGTTEWDVTIDNEADDLTDNLINDLSDVDATPAAGQVLKWDGSQWIAGDDDAGTSGAEITDLSWDDASDELSITEDGTTWNVTLDNEADDLSDNVINDLNDVNSLPSNGDFLQWDGTEWVAGSPAAASCVTLEEAYNCGGNGVGRSIAAEFGAVDIILPATATNNSGLTINSNKGTLGSPTSAMEVLNNQFGVAIFSETTSATNPYGAIQAVQSSSLTGTDLPSGVAGYHDGTGLGVGLWGETSTNSTAGLSYGIYGISSGTGNAFGGYLRSQSYPGIFAETNSAGAQAAQFAAAGQNPVNPGMLVVGSAQFSSGVTPDATGFGVNAIINNLNTEVTFAPDNGSYGYIGGAGTEWWAIYTSNAVQVSRRELKRDITYFDEDISNYVMNDIMQLKPSFYKYKGENDTKIAGSEQRTRYNMHLGFILDETPDYIQDNAFSGIDLYSLTSLSIAGVQANRKSIEKLETQTQEIHEFGTAQLNGNEIRVNFNKDFSGTDPVVTVTPHSPAKDYYILSQDENGFVLAVENPNNFKFNWIAMAEKTVNNSKMDNNINMQLKSQLEIDNAKKQEIRNELMQEEPQKTMELKGKDASKYKSKRYNQKDE